MNSKKSTQKPGTQTSTFGSSVRENHDSSRFYDSKLYKNIKVKIDKKIKYIENPVPPENLNRIFHHSSESMKELPDNSVHLMVTSPPYNVSKDYDDDLSLEEYMTMLRNVFSETYRVLVTGGRACINIANVGRKPYVPLHSYIIEEMLNIGFLMRGEIIWNKSASAGSSTAWGSWMSPSNPCLRDVHEYILVFCKESFSRKIDKKKGEEILQQAQDDNKGDGNKIQETVDETIDKGKIICTNTTIYCGGKDEKHHIPSLSPLNNRKSENNKTKPTGKTCTAHIPVGRGGHRNDILKREKTIQRDDFLTWTKSVWEFPTVSARKVGHPAPFPEELPHRLIQLYTYSNEVVLDPFCGSGTTCTAALKDKRFYVGYDIKKEYVELSGKKIEAAGSQLLLL